MHLLYLASVFLHILAAMSWIGGMFFLVFVVLPYLRRSGGVDPTFLRGTGLRFRSLTWGAFAVLLATGTFNLWYRGVRLSSFSNPDFLRSGFGYALMSKLTLVAAVLAVSAFHDFSVGPRAVRALERDAGSTEAARLRRLASRLGRATFVLALVIVGWAVALVRGMPALSR